MVAVAHQLLAPVPMELFQKHARILHQIPLRNPQANKVCRQRRKLLPMAPRLPKSNWFEMKPTGNEGAKTTMPPNGVGIQDGKRCRHCYVEPIKLHFQEDEIAMRAVILEQENLRLRFELERLRTEIERHRIVAFSQQQATTAELAAAKLMDPTALGIGAFLSANGHHPMALAAAAAMMANGQQQQLTQMETVPSTSSSCTWSGFAIGPKQWFFLFVFCKIWIECKF